MLRILATLCLILSFANPVFGAIEIKEDGVRKGYVQRLNFTGGPTVTSTGIEGIISLSGLDTTYLVKAGISGGQIAHGGTDSGDDLTLRGTSHGDNNGDVIINDLGGNVGIGTTAPSEKLAVMGSGTTMLRVGSNTGGDSLVIGFHSTNGPVIQGHTDSSGNSLRNAPTGRWLAGGWGLLFSTSPSTAIGNARTFTDRLIIQPDGDVGLGGSLIGGGDTDAALAGSVLVAKASGNVGIGTTDPAGKLTVKADANNNVLRLIETGAGTEYLDIKVSSLGNLDFITDGGSTAMTITDSGADVGIANDIFHYGDTNTKIAFTSDVITVTVGGEILLTLTEAAQDVVKLGDGGDVDINLNNDYLYNGTTGFIRTSDSSKYRRYYHLPISSFSPGVAGATWTSPSANTVGGWRLNAAGETLEFGTDIHSDWDGASDITAKFSFALNVAGLPADTVDLRLQCFYNGAGDTATKTQVLEVATVAVLGAQFEVYNMSFTINWDEANNVVEVGDHFGFILNLETDTSEIDDVIILNGGGSCHYNTTHIGIESGDI